MCIICMYTYKYSNLLCFSDCAMYSHEKLDYEGRKTIERDQFRMVHYAGDVTYSVMGFVDKNNDLLYRSLKEVRVGHQHHPHNQQYM